MSRRTVLLALAACLAGALIGPATAAAQESADKLADKLATLRAEVEELSAQLSDVTTETQNTMRSLARQKADLKVELDREKVRLAKLRSSLDKRREKIAEQSAEGEDLGPVFQAATTGLRTYVQGSLPFRTKDRLSAIARIEDQQKQGVLSYQRALSRLWGFVEDEFRMTRENAMFRQSIVLDGEEQLADVIRVGMVMLFFETSDDRVGYVEKKPQGYIYVAVEDPEQKRRITQLFDNYKKQIRVGYMPVPYALPPETK